MDYPAAGGGPSGGIAGICAKSRSRLRRRASAFDLAARISAIQPPRSLMEGHDRQCSARPRLPLNNPRAVSGIEQMQLIYHDLQPNLLIKFEGRLIPYLDHKVDAVCT